MKPSPRTHRYLAFQAHLHRRLRMSSLDYHLYPMALVVTPTTFLNTLPAAKGMTIAILELHFPELAPFRTPKDEFVDELLIRIVHCVRTQVSPHITRGEIEALEDAKMDTHDEELLWFSSLADAQCEWLLGSP